MTFGLWARRASRLLHPASVIILSCVTITKVMNGWRWIRTTEAICSRFTVCPLWPLGNPSIINNILFLQKKKADDRTRTDNLLITNQLLCQLSHIGIWDLQGSNLWPPACKADALPAELRSHAFCTLNYFIKRSMNDPEGTRTLDLRRDRAAL